MRVWYKLFYLPADRLLVDTIAISRAKVVHDEHEVLHQLELGLEYSYCWPIGAPLDELLVP